MEKFGIFELLDALSALTATGDAADSSPSAPSADGKNTDAAFDPPVYGDGAQPQAHGQDALKGFLARHDAVAKKAKK